MSSVSFLSQAAGPAE